MATKGAAGSSFSIGGVLSRRSKMAVRASSSRNTDEIVDAKNLVATRSRVAEEKPPRLCTLRAFSQDGGDSIAMGSSAWDSAASSVFLKQLAASVQATAQAQDFETISGRAAMVAFAIALGLEVVTGNNVFKGIEVKELGQTVAFSAACVICMAAFTAGWSAKNQIRLYMTKGCQDLVEFILTDAIDAMFFDQDDL
ncbi:LHC-related protein [Selaginella moellendorffii]|uniref:LHC-related protein n=1 Tax=Selaginella moellendorffii TaxID=88036 RepID=D8QYP3_SELML|nr:stress enhanced protein 2, chloroplastic [Selaginella moellendorffii]EFJ34276.1 LHC-related protein [Selaginella moellendorffii]|eukprot:XP_002963943.1 stress enhanced protein 2, chloroplastic [Selaginella moellendorffii]